MPLLCWTSQQSHLFVSFLKVLTNLIDNMNKMQMTVIPINNIAIFQGFQISKFLKFTYCGNPRCI